MKYLGKLDDFNKELEIDSYYLIYGKYHNDCLYLGLGKMETFHIYFEEFCYRIEGNILQKRINNEIFCIAREDEIFELTDTEIMRLLMLEVELA